VIFADRVGVIKHEDGMASSTIWRDGEALLIATSPSTESSAAREWSDSITCSAASCEVLHSYTLGRAPRFHSKVALQTAWPLRTMTSGMALVLE
jgi:hypothetical protein